MRPRRPASLVALALLLTPAPAMASCGAAGSRTGDDGARELTVLAAASLTDVFAELGDRFASEHGAEVTFSFGSSTDLAAQAAEGAPGDVLATADTASMRLAREAGVTGEMSEIATNVLVLVTGPGNPQDITTLADLEGTTWVRCADEVPCGRVAAELLGRTGVTAEPTSLEDDVRATLDKVTSGEVDAGLVYASDAVAAGDSVTTVEMPEAADVPTTYVAAPLEQGTDAELARAWVDLLLSDEGRRVLTHAGFTVPAR